MHWCPGSADVIGHPPDLGVVSMASRLAVSVQTLRSADASGDSGGGRCSYRRSRALMLLVSL